MATSAAPQLQSTGGVANLVNLLTLVKGSSSTTTNNLSTAGVEELVNSVLRGNQGLAAVASGQKSAGVYNSTVNTQMINDLVTSAATKAEAARSSQTTKVPGILSPQTLLQLGGVMGAQKLLGPSLKQIGSPLDKAGEKLSEAIFGPSATGGADAATSAAWSSGAGLGGDTLSAIGLGSAGELSAADLGISTAAESMAGLGEGATLAAGAEIGGSALGAGAMSAEAASAVAASDVAFAAEAATTAGEGAGLFETIAAAAAAWIICTELHKQGRMPTRFYVYGAREFLKYDEQGKRGYYIWAIPSVQHLRKYPDSWYSKLLAKVFNARAEYLTAKVVHHGARKTILGYVATHGLYAFCWILSRTIARSPKYSYNGKAA